MEVHPIEGADRDGEDKLEEVEDGEGEVARRHAKQAHIVTVFNSSRRMWGC